MNALPLFLIPLFIVTIMEFLAPLFLKTFSPIETIALIRILEIIFLLIFLKHYPRGLSHAGISRDTIKNGIRTGILWSIIFAVVVTISGMVLVFFNINPFKIIASPLPFKGLRLFVFLITGTLIAPVAEEIIFRGILYTWLRQINCPTALIVSTFIFSGFHYRGSALPLFQMVGGVVFALAFEHSKSIAAPIIIHCLGNLAIFLISLYVFG